jgi:hypothetical protein
MERALCPSERELWVKETVGWWTLIYHSLPPHLWTSNFFFSKVYINHEILAAVGFSVETVEKTKFLVELDRNRVYMGTQDRKAQMTSWPQQIILNSGKTGPKQINWNYSHVYF